jgi:hypothetical protein
MPAWHATCSLCRVRHKSPLDRKDKFRMNTTDPIRAGSRDAYSRGIVKNLVADPRSLPIRKGRRPLTVRGPLHVQCSDNSDHTVLRELVEEVAAWPGIEASPLPVGGGGLVSFRVNEGLASDDLSNFISGTEFARILFGAPTIYLTFPLSCAHWAIVRGWAEPHFSGSFGLMPPGVMVVYTPRDENEMQVCLSLFLTSYNFAVGARSSSPAELEILPQGMNHSRRIDEAIAV